MRCNPMRAFFSLVSLIFLLGNGLAQEPARLTAPQLFPEKTLAYVRIDNVAKLREDLKKSSLGKLGNDEELKPIFAEFYGTLVNSTAQMQESIGLNLDELLSIPNGEFAIALLPSDKSAAKATRKQAADTTTVNIQLEEPALALLLDAGEEITGVQVMLERLEKSMSADMQHSQKTIDRLTLHRYQNPNRERERFGYFIDNGVMIATTDPNYLEQLSAVWLGTAGEWSSLADNRRFTGILSRCVGTQGERPQLSFYADPMAIVRQFTPNTASSSMVLAMLPAFGLDGIQGVGGSWIVAPPDFDSIAHFHLSLESPRKSIMGLLRPKKGSTTPEDWVPESVASYSTINWDTASTLKAVEQLYNQFRGPEAFDKEVLAQTNDRLQIDLRKDVLENLDGRFTLLQGFVRPVTINSGSNVYAIKMKNAEYIKNTVMPKVFELIESRTEVATENFGKFTARVLPVNNRRGNQGSDSVVRQPEVCVAFVDDYLVFADSKYMMQQVADCLSGSTAKLNQALDFELISDRITAQLQNKECSTLSYSRPEESLQLFYELARDPKNRDRLRQVSDNNGFFKALLAGLDKRELPPFSVIAKYLAPAGGFLVDDDTGLHYMSFSLRRE
jgi:Protein of unknown function (DUF3352)